MRTLAVYVPALSTTAEEWKGLVERLRRDPTLGGVTWKGWNHAVGPLTRARVLDKARALRAFVDQQWATANPRYDAVVLLGHSFGGVLVRQAYLLAAGASSYGDPPSEFADAVTRIVLFAAPNRGVDLKRRLSTRWAFRMLRPLGLARARGVFANRILGDLVVGSSFVTELRMQWIRHFRETANVMLPEVVQLRGTVDTVVEEDDSLDLCQFPKLYFVDVADADHRNLHLPEADATDPEGRYRYLRRAIAERLEAAVPEPEPAAKSPVVFVLHGIRASNRTWARQVETMIHQHAPNAHVVRSSYGYFSALRFALPWVRRRHVHWFQDAYSETLARFPNADFHFIGHSNGTYLLGHALARLPGMRFRRVVLAGSVLPAEYDWAQRFNRRQADVVHNHCANRDVPVGVLCSALRGLRMRDVGTAGYTGFLWAGDSARIREFHYHPGGHSAALRAPSLQAMVQFLISGTGEDPPGLALPTDVSRVFDVCTRLAHRLAMATIAALVVVLGVTMYVFGPTAQTIVAAAAVLAAVLLVLSVI